MKVWLVNPFDPLFGEREQLGRYGRLAEALALAGHDVLWWSSTFSHRFKREVDATTVTTCAAAIGVEVRLVPTPPYTKNLSYRRLRSHKTYARAFRAAAGDEPRPDIMVASSPPLESACEVARLGRTWGIPAFIDIQDQWPDNFARIIPRALRWLRGPLLRRYYAVEREAYTLADGIIGVAQGYVDRGVAVGGHKRHEAVFPLGVDVEALDAAAAHGATLYAHKWKKPEGQVWLIYSGSLSHNYDFLTIIHAAQQARARFGDRVRFVITGNGELAEKGR
ncbi:MAG: glycosyltransferase, partial [Phycisphaerae bacterium]